MFSVHCAALTSTDAIIVTVTSTITGSNATYHCRDEPSNIHTTQCTGGVWEPNPNVTLDCTKPAGILKCRYTDYFRGCPAPSLNLSPEIDLKMSSRLCPIPRLFPKYVRLAFNATVLGLCTCSLDLYSTEHTCIYLVVDFIGIYTFHFNIIALLV